MLKIKDLSKSYFIGKTRQDVLKDVSFSLPEKGLYFIVGKSGSGKSTLLNLIGGLDKPDAGSILFDGKDITKMKEKELSSYRARKIGFVFQEFNLISGMTVEDNLLLSTDRKVSNEEIDSLLSRAELLQFKKKKVELLSGGEKQRVSLVRAILKESRMILCDEPTGSLDSENATNVFSLLKEVSKERLVLVVTHDRESAEKYQDGIIEISDGKVTAPVTPMEEQKEDYQEEKGLRLSFGKRIRLAFSLMKKRPARMIIMLLISIFSFSFFGISDAMSSFDENNSILHSMKNDRYPSIGVTKSFTSDEVTVTYDMNDDDIESIETICDGTGLPIDSFAKGWNINNGNRHHEVDVPISQSSKLFTVNGAIEAKKETYDSFGYTLIGLLPKKKNEIIISDYFAELFRLYGLIDEDNKKTEITNRADIIGKEVRFTDINRCYDFLPETYIVSGILNTSYAFERYAPLFDKELRDDKTDVYHLACLLLEDINSNLYNVIGFSKEFYDTYQPLSWNDRYLTFSDYNLYMALDCKDTVSTVKAKINYLCPFDALEENQFTLKAPYSSLSDLPDNAIILEEDMFKSISWETYHESDFTSFALHSEALGINKDVIIAGYTNENYPKSKGAFFINHPLFEEASNKLEPLKTDYSRFLFLASGNIKKDTSRLNKIENYIPKRIHGSLKGQKESLWESTYIVYNAYYSDLFYPYTIKTIMKIVTLVSLVGLLISALFFLFSILEIINRSMKKVGILYAQGYSLFSISLTYLLQETLFAIVIALLSCPIAMGAVSLISNFLLSKTMICSYYLAFSFRQILWIILALLVTMIIGFVPSFLKIKKIPIADILSERK